MTWNCKWCGREFELDSGNGVFCCVKCKRDYYKAEEEEEAEEQAAEERRKADEQAKEAERKKDPKRWYGSEWVEHLINHPEDSCECNWSSLNGKDILNLLKVQPEFSIHCNLSLLSPDEWGRLLCTRPELADSCTCWASISCARWVWMLRSHAEYAEQCPRAIWESFNGDQLASVIRRKPRFFKTVGARTFDGKKWADFLSQLPGYAEYCDWKKLSSDDWAVLLKAQPKFVNEWLDVLNAYDGDVESTQKFVDAIDAQWFSHADIGKLIAIATHHRILREHVAWDKLRESVSTYQWGGVADNERVEFAVKVDVCANDAIGEGFDPNALKPLNLFWAMDKWPEKCQSFNSDSYDWSQCDMDPTLWARLTFFYPQFKRYCDPSKVDWSLLDQEDDMRFWCWALAGCPDEVIGYFHTWEKIPRDWWPQLVERQPKLAKYRDKYCPKSKPPEKDSPQAAESAPPPSAVRDSDQKTDARENVNRPSPSKTESPDRKPGLVKKYWMPALAVLFILSAFGEGGAASFFIGAGLGAFWWWKKRRG